MLVVGVVMVGERIEEGVAVLLFWWIEKVGDRFGLWCGDPYGVSYWGCERGGRENGKSVGSFKFLVCK